MLPPTDCFVEFPRRDFPRLTHFGVVHHSTIGDVGLHRHPGYEVKYFFEGAGTLRVGRERTIKIGPDDAVITAPGFDHTFKLRGRGISFYWLGFQAGDQVQREGTTSLRPNEARRHSSAFDNSFLGVLDGDTRELAEAVAVHGYTVLRCFPALHSVFRDLARELREGQHYARQMVYLKVMELFTLIGRRMGEPEVSQSPMHRARRYLEANFDTPLRLSSLSRITGLTPAYISRRFRQEFGVPPMAYLAEYRLGKAREYLSEGESVTETARMCGFSSVHYFSAFFTRRTGQQPTAYARQARSPER